MYFLYKKQSTYVYRVETLSKNTGIFIENYLFSTIKTTLRYIGKRSDKIQRK